MAHLSVDLLPAFLRGNTARGRCCLWVFTGSLIEELKPHLTYEELQYIESNVALRIPCPESYRVYDTPILRGILTRLFGSAVLPEAS